MAEHKWKKGWEEGDEDNKKKMKVDLGMKKEDTRKLRITKGKEEEKQAWRLEEKH